MEDAIGEIQQATNEGIEKINKATQEGLNAINNAKNDDNVNGTDSNIKNSPPIKYAVINPETGKLVYPDEPNYEKYKEELGGDAGTTTTDKSTACQAALKKINERREQERAEREAKIEAQIKAQERPQPATQTEQTK